MSNSDTEIGAEYWRLTTHDLAEMFALGIGTEGGPDEPPKFTVFTAAERISLSSHVLLRLGDAYVPFDGAKGRSITELPEDERLSALLYYSYGFSRVVLGPTSPRYWPYHRFVASSRCFYPTEMYVWLPEGSGRPAGIYHYDELHHALVRLRPGDWRDLLGASVDADLSGAECVVFLTSLFWKNAFRYRHYSYRLCTQEAGLVVGNVLMVAAALGLRGHVHYQFLDDVVNRLLGGRDGEESAMALIALYPESDAGGRTMRPLGRPRTSAGLLDEVPRIAPRRPDWPATGPHDLWSWVRDIDAASHLGDTGAFRRLDTRATSRSGGGAVTLPAPAAAGTDLVAALRRRNSGPLMFNPGPEALPADAFARIVRHALHPYLSDVGPTPLARCLVVVHTVDGVEPGVYELARSGGGLHRISAEPVRNLLNSLGVSPPSVNIRSANAVIYLVGHHREALACLGNRGYRILTQDAGVVAQRLSVMSGSVSFAARIHNGIPMAAAEEALGLSEREHALLFQVVVGKQRVTGQCEPSIVF